MTILRSGSRVLLEVIRVKAINSISLKTSRLKAIKWISVLISVASSGYINKGIQLIIVSSIIKCWKENIWLVSAIWKTSSSRDMTEVTKSQRNKRRQRRLQIFPKNFTFEAWKINVKCVIY